MINITENTTFVAREFTGETFHIRGFEVLFKDCHFENCTIISERGDDARTDLTLIGCVVSTASELIVDSHLEIDETTFHDCTVSIDNTDCLSKIKLHDVDFNFVDFPYLNIANAYIDDVAFVYCNVMFGSIYNSKIITMFVARSDFDIRFSKSAIYNLCVEEVRDGKMYFYRTVLHEADFLDCDMSCFKFCRVKGKEISQDPDCTGTCFQKDTHFVHTTTIN